MSVSYSVFSTMQIPYPKRKVIFDSEPSKEEKPDPHKVIIIELYTHCTSTSNITLVITLVFDSKTKHCTEGYAA